MYDAQLESEAVPRPRSPFHILAKISAFAALLFVATLVNWSYPGIYGRGFAFVFVMLTLLTLTGLCLPLSAGCLAVLLFHCSLGVLRVYQGYPVVLHLLASFVEGSMHNMAFLLVVHAGRWIARRIEQAWSINRKARSARREQAPDHDAEPPGSAS